MDDTGAPTSGQRGRRRRRSKETRPGEIADAALKVFAEKGFAAARLEDVAERAGASKGTIYLYYSTKEALFEAVVRGAFVPMLERLSSQVRDSDATCEALLKLILRTLHEELVGTDRREILRLMIAEAPRFPRLVEFYHREAVSRGKALLAAVIARGVERGEFRAGPAAACPEVVLGPAIMAAVWKLVFEPVEPMDLAEFTEAHVDLVLHGLIRP